MDFLRDGKKDPQQENLCPHIWGNVYGGRVYKGVYNFTIDRRVK